MSRRLLHAVQRSRLLNPGDRVAVALSGGADSVALTLLLARRADQAPWTFAGLIHVNHHLRGVESDQDADFCRVLAERLALPIQIVDVDVTGRSRETRLSIEAAARAARYEAFDRAASALGATVVATAHTADDQAETVMLRLLRGAATRGASGIRPRMGRVIRPLLACRRAELRAFLADAGQAFREDSSNADESISRNRLRHRLMPAIEAFEPAAVSALARFAAHAEADEEALEAWAEQFADAVAVQSGTGGVQVDRERLAGLPDAVLGRVLRRALDPMGVAPTARVVAAMITLVRADTTVGKVDLAKWVVRRDGSAVILAPRASGRSCPEFAVPLPLPGRIEFKETGVTVSASMKRGHLTTSFPNATTEAMLQASSIQAPFLVRSRRPGDRIRPFGAPGTRKLQDVLVDRKIPRSERDRLVIVEDSTGSVVWVAGVTIADGCRVTAPESGVVILKIEKGNQ